MKNVKLIKLALMITGALVLSISASSCKKDSVAPASSNNNTVHHVDSKLVGKWLWTEASDAYYDDDGVYVGAAYGLAFQFTINADGTGTCFNHIYSSLEVGSSLEVNISSTGFFESDDQGHLGYFPTSGTYKSSSGTNRPLGPTELWNTSTNTGFKNLFQKVVITTQGGRQCFQVTASNGVVDTFFKVP